MEKAIARILRVLLVLVMAFDCQRYPAVPEKGNIEIVGRRYRR